ncbi:MAG: SufD family Fe-S cluster assembly protein, partial [Prosthecobacter sp.]|nr:SufD family Fe-S cluster assembly protein [Prosthecobacter sp.]
MTAQPACYLAEKSKLACTAASRLGPDFEKLRARFFAELSTLTAPVRSDELWRYTHFDRFDFPSLATPAQVDATLTLLDGQSIPDMSGLKFLANPAADAGFVEALASLAAEDAKREYWRALQFASAASGFSLEVAPGCERPEWLLLKHGSAAARGGVSSLGVVRVRKGASLKIFEDFDAELAGLWLPRVEFVVEDGARLEYVCLQRFGSKVTCLGRQRFHLGRDTQVKLTHLFCGGLLSRFDLDCIMKAPGAEVEMRGLYLASGRQQIDFHPLQAHLAPHCKSH